MRTNYYPQTFNQNVYKSDLLSTAPHINIPLSLNLLHFMPSFLSLSSLYSASANTAISLPSSPPAQSLIFRLPLRGREMNMEERKLKPISHLRRGSCFKSCRAVCCQEIRLTFGALNVCVPDNLLFGRVSLHTVLKMRPIRSCYRSTYSTHTRTTQTHTYTRDRGRRGGRRKTEVMFLEMRCRNDPDSVSPQC